MSKTAAPAADLLPHFTPLLALALTEKICQRIIEDGISVPIHYADGQVAYKRHQPTSAEAYKIAEDLCDRIYRTQLREAKATLSFAEATIAFDRKHPRPQPAKTLTSAIADQIAAAGLMMPTGKLPSRGSER